jgi:Tfp pilus assembly protein PilN
MSLYSPDNVVLNSFTMRHGQPLEIIGTAPTAAMVVDFQQTLAGSPLLEQVELGNMTRVLPGGSRKPDDAEVRFTLKAPLWADRELGAAPARRSAREPSL